MTGLLPVLTFMFMLHFDTNGKGGSRSRFGKFLSSTKGCLPHPKLMTILWWISYILFVTGAFLLFVRFNNGTTSYNVSNAFLGLYFAHIILAWFWVVFTNVGFPIWSMTLATLLVGTVVAIVVLAAVGGAWVTFGLSIPLAILLLYAIYLG